MGSKRNRRKIERRQAPPRLPRQLMMLMMTFHSELRIKKMTEYVFKISTNDAGVVFETPDINPEHEDNVREGIAYLSVVLVSIFINDISKHIKENQKDFIFTAKTMIDNTIKEMEEK